MQMKAWLLPFLLFALSVGLSSSLSLSPGAFLRQLTSPAFGSSPNPYTENGRDPDYPWCFTGRLWFRPAIVRIPSSPLSPHPSVSVLNIFGWTIGGTVALEYDTSPVGPYQEYVTMGSVVGKRGGVGQWGSRLYVSTTEAEQVCQDTWSVPAELANIDFIEGEDKDSLLVSDAPDKSVTGVVQNIAIEGWAKTRVLSEEELSTSKPMGGLPVLWTPSIKALWAPFVLFPNGDDNEEGLPLHRLKLSASALRLTFCQQSPSDLLGIPIGIGLVVDNVLIEISRQDGEL